MTDSARTASASRSSELELILEWEGQVDNARVRDLLAVKSVWASRLIAELADRLGTKIRRPLKHGPLILSPQSVGHRKSPDPYLRLLAASPGGLEADALVHDTRVDLTSVSPAIFACVRRAARDGTGLEIQYRSMSNPEGSKRVVYPHAIIRAARRWHMRAWCEARQDFRDFALARIERANPVNQTAPHRQGDDALWSRRIDLTLLPHPGLTPAQQAVIATEFFPGASARRLRIREALATYVLQDLRVATDPERQLPPDFQLALAPGPTPGFGSSPHATSRPR